MNRFIIMLALVFGGYAHALSAPSQSALLNSDSEAQIERYVNAFSILLPELNVQADMEGGWAAVEELELVSKFWRGEEVEPRKLHFVACCPRPACGCFD